MSMPDITVGGWFAARAARSMNRRALTFEGETYTYGQLLDRVDRLAAGLRAGGLNHGDRIAFLGLNQSALLETLLAAARLGAIFVPLNFRLAGPELAFIVGDASVHTIVVDAANQATIDAVADQIPVHRYVAVDGSADAQARWTSYTELIGDSEPLPAPDAVGADELAVIMYTSGTTGQPKGVMLSHANLFWNNLNLMHLYDVLEDDVTLVISPMFHIAGLNVTIFTTWMKGGEVVVRRSFDAQTTLDDIQQLRVSTIFGIPAMFSAISQLPTFDTADVSALRTVICGGAPVPEPLIRRYVERGIQMLQGYGLTETAPAAVFLVSEHALTKLGAAGKAPLFVEAKLIDCAGAEVTAPDVRGEVCIRGANVTRGYWKRPEATAAAFDGEGWFHTGDVGRYDEDGFIHIVDRVKDMIITGGENVYPAEVENVVHGHPAIAEAAVIGLPDERWGEAVTAVVTLRDGQQLGLEDLREFTSASLARYKLPSRLHVVDELPRNPPGEDPQVPAARQPRWRGPRLTPSRPEHPFRMPLGSSRPRPRCRPSRPRSRPSRPLSRVSTLSTGWCSDCLCPQAC